MIAANGVSPGVPCVPPLAQEFNMAGSGSVKHYELGNGPAVPAPGDPGRVGERSDPGRHARDGGGEIDR
ncbi:hypothetical protein OHB36_21770 [Streptomyces sp. NBC_00320]|uniref:hypothetical protein n=1 Tax=Streptomyces sp. NBC_00320 TaxID=2975711 RepID=UPI000B274BAD|nr:hypothetical protein [Streptomyces sp. NBC_00320]MCX5149374.1 hypothetical protein [Streptomyces sp. NBC_00320]